MSFSLPDMSVNTSLLHLNLSSSNSDLPSTLFLCLTSVPSNFIFISFCITQVLLFLPLCILILYLGLQRWQKQHSTSTTAMTNHSDSFTYHMVIMELVGVLGYIFICCGIYGTHVYIVIGSNYLCAFAWNGEMFFHILTCAERYLAVVHPIIYLSLKGERGVRIRNISIGCVWLLCFVKTSLMPVEEISYRIIFVALILTLIIVSYFSLSVLCVLIWPGPGEQGGNRQRVDQSKQRAFYTILVILGALMLRFSWDLSWVIISLSEGVIECVLMISSAWFNLPCSLVLPLLFLHRAGASLCYKKDTE